MSRKKTGLRSSRGGGKEKGHAKPPSQFGLVNASSADSSHGTVAFTMTDDARQTPQHNGLLWSQDVSLRSKPLYFVSAGVSEVFKQPDIDSVEPTTTYDKTSAKATGVDITRAQEKDTGLQAVSKREAEPLLSIPSDKTMGSYDGDISQNRRQCSSPGSSSSDEVILFQGRNGNANRKGLITTNTSCLNKKARKMGQGKEAKLKTTLHQPQSVLSVLHEKKKKTNQQHGRRHSKKGEDDLLTADYIANIREHDDLGGMLDQQQFGSRDLGNADTAIMYSRDTNGSSEVEYATASSLEIDKSNAGISAKFEYPGRHLDLWVDYLSDSASDDATSAVTTDSHGADASGFDAVDRHLSRSNSLLSKCSRGKGTIQNTPMKKDLDFKKWRNNSWQRWEYQDVGMDVSMNELDSELYQQIQIAWKKDRLKKSQRKKQREELRIQGKLGRSNANDLRTKYPTGMSMLQVADELKIFLIKEIEILIMPSMDKHGRKMIHELANKFHIKSKSTGRADQRRPTLYRTGRTMPFTQSSFDQAIGHINRRFIPRLDVKGKHVRQPQTRSSTAATSYHEGEAIGGTAPELGAQNRGRAMLERMGWSRGTALGATNKGILQPVVHTMKKTKSGLA